MRPLTPELVSTFQRLDTCSVSNAIETFDFRLRNEGFADGRIRCVFPDHLPVLGHAVTARIRSSSPPTIGHSYHDRTDWWNHILTVADPRIIVVEDVDDRPGIGAFVGEVHARIVRALGCVAYVTNGSVRDLPALSRMGFQCFAGSVAVSHAFAHLIDFGEPVEIAGLGIRSGDLLFGDIHGIVSIPGDLAAEIPKVVAMMRERERAIAVLCESPDFSIATLRSLVRQLG